MTYLQFIAAVSAANEREGEGIEAKDFYYLTISAIKVGEPPIVVCVSDYYTRIHLCTLLRENSCCGLEKASPFLMMTCLMDVRASSLRCFGLETPDFLGDRTAEAHVFSKVLIVE